MSTVNWRKKPEKRDLCVDLRSSCADSLRGGRLGWPRSAPYGRCSRFSSLPVDKEAAARELAELAQEPWVPSHNRLFRFMHLMTILGLVPTGGWDASAYKAQKP